MRKVKKTLLTSLLAGALLLPMSVSAYSGTYSFDIHSSVQGTKVHSLAQKKTTTKLTANSYDSNGNISSTKYKYSVSLVKFLKSYSVSATANGYSTTKDFGTVNAGDYKVNVLKNTGTIYNRVKGSGTINQ
ncbi:hypothetical protein ACFFIY_12210 [Bhargavaea ullalensis]|uniref:Uncharacterized protein n=1 Tax=Bhargavaea ullalensis TaxID=1265685 RepID=A0ABV2G7Y3_9BACL